MTAVQKIGYDGTLLFELAAHGSPKATLARAQKARARMERLLATTWAELVGTRSGGQIGSARTACGYD